MSTCPSCGVVYMAGESHVCRGKGNPMTPPAPTSTRGLIKALAILAACLVFGPVLFIPWEENATLRELGLFLLGCYLLVSLLSAIVVVMDCWKRDWLNALAWCVFVGSMALIALPLYLLDTKPKKAVP